MVRRASWFVSLAIGLVSVGTVEVGAETEGAGGESVLAEVAKLTASDASERDEFGNAISLDGDSLAVGAVRAMGVESSAGAAYLFRREPSGDWVEAAKLVASDGATSDAFGRSISLGGRRFAIGSPGDDDVGFAVGAAYIFELDDDGRWVEIDKLLPTDAGEDRNFGEVIWSTAIA